MPRYTADVSCDGWFAFTADDDEDAANVASELISDGGYRLAGIELVNVEIESVERVDD